MNKTSNKLSLRGQLFLETYPTALFQKVYDVEHARGKYSAWDKFRYKLCNRKQKRTLTHIELRVLMLAKAYICYNCTIKDLVIKFGIPRSTVHHDLCHRLPYIDEELYRQTRVIALNNSIRRSLATINKHQ